jgi:hypothetical protein
MGRFDNSPPLKKVRTRVTVVKNSALIFKYHSFFRPALISYFSGRSKIGCNLHVAAQHQMLEMKI